MNRALGMPKSEHAWNESVREIVLMAKPYKIKNMEAKSNGKEVLDERAAQAFIKENNLVTAEDAQTAVKELFKDALQEMLEAELETDLGYGKTRRRVNRGKTAVTATAARRSAASMAKWI